MDRLAGVLYAVAAGVTLLGVALWVVPTRLGTASPIPLAGQTDTAPRVARDTSDLESLQAIVAGNILSSTRSAPRSRFTPPEMSPSAGGVAGSGTPSRAAFQLRLYGTVVGPEGASALIDADPRIPGAEIFRVGDRLGDRRVAAITDSTVVLTGGRGPLVLRLEPRGRRP